MPGTAAILLEANRVGIVINLRGDGLRVIGLGGLSDGDAAQWRDRIRAEKPEILAALGGNDDPAGEILHNLGVKAVLVTDSDRARYEVGSLVSRGSSLGLDIETMPNAEEAARHEMLTAELAWATCAARGPGEVPVGTVARLREELAAASTAALHPGRGKIRLVQVYAGGKTAVVFDLTHVDITILAPLWELPLIIHNALFELKFLQEAGIELERFACTMQMAGLAGGVEHWRSIDWASREFLNISLSKKKEMQKSDWSAPSLSRPQVNYAALDAVLAFKLAGVLGPRLRADRTMGAYRIQRDVLPAVARMERRGVGFDRDAHAALLVELKDRRLQLEAEFEKACIAAGKPELAAEGAPSTPAKVGKLLEAILPAEELAAWPMTPKGKAKSTAKTNLDRGKHHEPVALLIKIGKIDKQLESFGSTLASFVHDGRIHAGYKVAHANTGRASCASPNVQQTPKKADGKRFRELYVAAPGHVLVGGDWRSMEMRAAAYVARDVTMTEIFASDGDLHATTAEGIIGKPLKDLPEEEGAAARDAAKAVNFGSIYGMGAGGLVATTWKSYGRDIDLQTAQDWLAAFDRKYPQLAEWKRTHADICSARGYVRIAANTAGDEGRIHRFAWNGAPKPGKGDRRASSYTQSCNLPVQGSCADASMLALTMIDKALADHGIPGGPVIWCHDEIVMEVPEEAAKKSAELLGKAMTDAFVTVFPGAPANNLVDVKIGRSWADTK